MTETSGRDDGAEARPDPAAGELSVDTSVVDGVVRASVRGELDEGTAPTLISSVEAAIQPGHDLVIDLAGLTFCGSAGLSALIMIERKVSTSRGSLTVVRPTPFLQELLELAGLDDLVRTEPGA